MLFLKHSEYKKRLEICRACKFFEPSTQSCGPLIIGSTEEVEVKFKRKSIKLCGCVMPIKAKLSFALCPASKWDGTLTLKEQIEFKRFLLNMEANGKLEDKDMLEFYKFKDKATNAFNERSTCPPCVKRDIKLFLDSMEHLIVE